MGAKRASGLLALFTSVAMAVGLAPMLAFGVTGEIV